MRRIGLIIFFFVCASGSYVAVIVTAACVCDSPVPSTIPSAARNGFSSILRSTKSLTYQPVAYGITVADCPLLLSIFPNQTFVRVSRSIERHWWLPDSWSVSYSGPHVHIYSIPHTGESPLKVVEESDLNHLLSNGHVFVRSTRDADFVRALILELCPRMNGLPSVHRRISDREWHIAVQDLGSSVCYWKVDTDPEGCLLSIRSQTAYAHHPAMKPTERVEQ